MSEEKIIYTTGMTDCGGQCLLKAHVRCGKVVKMTTETPAEAGDNIPLCACAKGLNYHKTFLGDDRLLYPMKRVGERGEGKFERISWEEAVDTIAREWVRIRDTYGPGSRYIVQGAGMCGVLEGKAFARRLLALDGGYLDYYNSYSTACSAQASVLMCGTRTTGNSLASWLESKLIILWSHNPADTRFDAETMYYLKKAKEKGIPIIAVDPRRSNTVDQLEAEWIPLRPATDAALLDAMAYVIYESGLHDQDFLDRCCVGFDKDHMPEGIDPSECYLSYLLGETDGIAKTPEWAAPITGVSAEAIRSLAIRYATAKPAALIQGLGAQRHVNGEQAVRGGILLACMTGNVGRWGGWACGDGLYKGHETPSFPIGNNPFPLSIPTFTWTDAVLRGHEMTALDGVAGGEQLPTDVKMIFSLAGNCLINQHSDINRTAALLKDTSKCEFIVCSDIFMTSSAKYADILLPGVSSLERNDITVPWRYGNFLGYACQVVDPLGECRLEYDWMTEVAEKLGLKEAFTQGRSADEWLEYIYNDLRCRERELPPYKEFSKGGIFRYQNNPPFIAFEQACKDPERFPFPTPSGKIEIFSEKVYRTEYRSFFPAIPRYISAIRGHEDPLAQQYPLQMIGWHCKRRTHSIHDNNAALHKLEPQRLWMNPADAATRGIADGDEVLVWNDRGRTRTRAKVTDRIMPGVTALAEGAWYSPDSDGTDTAGSINVLTTWQPTAYARGNGQHTNLIEVKKI